MSNTIFASLFLLLNCAIVADATEYRIVDLGAGGQTYAYASCINDSGQAAGVNSSQGLLWENVVASQNPVVLGSLFGRISNINNSGYMVGYDEIAGHAFIWQNGAPRQDLGTLGGNGSRAYGINDDGQVVGDSRYASGNTFNHAFLWQNGSPMQDLGTLGGNRSGASSINASGQVVGYAELDGNVTFHPFLWQSGSPMRDLGSLGGRGLARSINDRGQVVGYSNLIFGDTGMGSSRAFLWQEGSSMQDIGTLSGHSSTAADINNSGVVVGYSDGRAFVWQEGLPMQSLGTLPGYEYSEAYAINDGGQIVGYSYTIETGTGRVTARATLWQPVPEPSSLLAMLCTFSGLAGVIRRRGKIVGC